MEMSKIGRAIALYLIASGACVVPGMVIVALANELFLIDIPIWHAVGLLWLLVVGLPSMAASANEVARVLGKRESAWIGATQIRRIPVFGDVARIGKNPRTIKSTIPVAEGLIFGRGELTIPEERVRHFLVRSWVRQSGGSPYPLSRTWWVGERRMEREEYDVILEALLMHGFVRNRRRGASGKLVAPPQRIFIELKHTYGD